MSINSNYPPRKTPKNKHIVAMWSRSVVLSQARTRNPFLDLSNLIALMLICLAIICVLAGAAQSKAPVTESAYTKAVGLYNTKKFADALVIFETGKIDSTQAANAAYYRALSVITRWAK